MAARGSIRAHVERTATLLNGTGEVRLKRLPGAGCGSARTERRLDRRAQDDRRILGGSASLRAAAWALESLRSVCFAPRRAPCRWARYRRRRQALLRSRERDPIG